MITKRCCGSCGFNEFTQQSDGMVNPYCERFHKEMDILDVCNDYIKE